MKTNVKKCGLTLREMVTDFPPSKLMENRWKLLMKQNYWGLTVTSNLKWNSHVNNIVLKSSKRIYLLVQLKRAKVSIQDIFQFYSVCVRPVLEYASTVFHYSIPKYLSDEIEHVQKRALRIVYPNLHYEDALIEAGMESLHTRRQKPAINFLNRF